MRVLLASADNVERLALETLLREWGCDIVSATSGREAWRALNEQNPPPLALLQWSMPDLDGLALCALLRDRPDAPYIYIILMGDGSAPADPLEALETGADDFLPSPLNQASLRLRLRAAEHILSLQRNLLDSRQALEYKSTHDALTGVWNRGEALGLLDREIARAQREGTTCSIIMIDLDHFKEVNDLYGHVAGDIALREVCQRLVRCIRPYDAIGRYGGEEFLVLLSGCSARNAASLAERLRQEVSSQPVTLPEAQITQTISLGVASWDSKEYGDMQALIRAADAALYRAKRQGRNCVETAWQDTTGLAGRDPAAA